MSCSPRRSRAAAAVAALAAAWTLAAPAAGQRGRAPQPAPQPGRAAPPAAARPADEPQQGALPRRPEGRLKLWFGALDLDGNAWLSLRETTTGLGFDAGRFRVFDLDRDGRLRYEEYGGYYDRLLERGDERLAEPRPADQRRAAPPRRDPLQLRVAFDRDLDRAIDQGEFGDLLAAYGHGDFDVAVTFRRADVNGDQRLDVGELTRISVFLDPILVAASPGLPSPGGLTLDAVLGTRVERGAGQPPQIRGPVPPFWRLDVDDDGFVEDTDLATLTGRLHVAISARGVLAALDRDGDGRLSRLELRMSMDETVRPEGPETSR